jgi:hypothetical protein
MEIQSLKVLVTEQDLSTFALQALRENDQVSDVRVSITPDAVVLAGVYRLMMRVSFETRWSVEVRSGKLAATLRDLKAGGFGAGMLKGVLMSLLQSHASREEGVEVTGDTIVVDPDRLLAGRGFVVRTNLFCVRKEMGKLILASEGCA